jgi:hypothetical protein
MRPWLIINRLALWARWLTRVARARIGCKPRLTNLPVAHFGPVSTSRLDQAVADANHVLFFNAGEEYQISHPVGGGDECLSLVIAGDFLRELAPASLLRKTGDIGFRHQHQRIDPRAQALVVILRHCMQNHAIEPLEAETLLLALLCRSSSMWQGFKRRPRSARPRTRISVRLSLIAARRKGARYHQAKICES